MAEGGLAGDLDGGQRVLRHVLGVGGGAAVGVGDGHGVGSGRVGGDAGGGGVVAPEVGHSRAGVGGQRGAAVVAEGGLAGDLDGGQRVDGDGQGGLVGSARRVCVACDGDRGVEGAALGGCTDYVAVTVAHACGQSGDLDVTV